MDDKIIGLLSAFHLMREYVATSDMTTPNPEVAEHLVEVVHDTAMNRARCAEALLIAALWSKKHRKFQMPHELNNKVRLLV